MVNGLLRSVPEDDAQHVGFLSFSSHATHKSCRKESQQQTTGGQRHHSEKSPLPKAVKFHSA
jgi:hypothetical protein